jgi:hypothetical protein
MQALLSQALQLFVGSELYFIHPNDPLPDQARLDSSVLSSCCSRRFRKILRKRGYTYLHSFLTLPSTSTPRWLLPVGDRHKMIAGTALYEPHKRLSLAAKKALIGMIRLGWRGECCPRILLASKSRFELEELVRSVTGEAHPVFAMSFGRQPAVRKLTVQVMRPSGELLGYIKLPLTDAAVERVRNEAQVVNRLWSFPALRPHIPRLLYGGAWNNTHVVFQSPLEGERGPLTFNGMHQAFLDRLWDAHSVELPGERLVNAMAVNWEKTSRSLGNEWEEIGEEVLRRSVSDLRDKTVRCGVTHGDLAPWNTRLKEDELLLFDWESADWQAPNSWDIFHFQVRTYFLNSKKGLHIVKRDASDESSFMLYCLSSVCQLRDEENFDGIERYKQLLIRAFQRRPSRVEEPASVV